MHDATLPTLSTYAVYQNPTSAGLSSKWLKISEASFDIGITIAFGMKINNSIASKIYDGNKDSAGFKVILLGAENDDPVAGVLTHC